MTVQPTVPPPSTATVGIDDPDITLMVPVDDTTSPVLSIVIPALNEEITIERFIDWCHEGIAQAGIEAEILIVDSGSDRTAELALAKGARVLKTPRRGLGRAYIDATPYARGRFLILGDCDCTYDFRELRPFVDQFEAGKEFIMGSRFAGSIEAGSMPFLHRLGTPATTWILNRVYSTKFSDIHCGMRGVTKDALLRMDIQSQSWEYASEMIVKAVRLELDIAEIPVHFYKDPEGRFSHHKREGWMSPWKAAWINLRAMFVYGADFFLYRPGLVLLILGLVVTVPLAFGPVTVAGIELSLYWLLIGVTLAIVGLESFYLGCLTRVIYDHTGVKTARLLERFRYTRTTLIAMGIFGGGVLLVGSLAWRWVTNDFKLPGPLSAINYLAIFGLFLMVAGFTTFTFMLVLNALADRMARRARTVL
ncbi:MAG TPA: glycosyltransferase family 2 protein [Acidimicrobiia bacterium]|jgi:glycosyltransferase involved in cell wall biosynthesis